MKIAFIIPDKEMMWDSVHQGVGYVAAYAKKNVPDINEIRVFRTYDKSLEQLDKFLDYEWDVIGITLTTPAVKEAYAICESIRKFSQARIVVGGAEVMAIEEKIFEQLPLLDYAITGEGEKTFADLLLCLNDNGEPGGIDGLIYKDKNKVVRKNRLRRFTDDLGEFPWPDRTLFEYDYRFHSIIGTRGCPYHCTFCNSSANWKHRYRLRPPADVCAEIEQVVSLYGRGKYFAFNDDAFNINKKWVVELCRQIKPLNVHIWIRGMRAGLITKEVADSLRAAGCFGVAVGVESADNTALKVMRKATNVEEIVRGVEILKASGIKNLIGQFIIGNQGDTLETVKKSIEFSKIFSEPTFGIAYPIPNTALYDYVEENGYLLPERVPIKHKGKVIDWILFDTPHFTVEERLQAVELAIKAKVYHGIDYSAE